MNVKRLVILARHLRRREKEIEAAIADGQVVLPRGFDLTSWYRRRARDNWKDHAGRSCGTTACAFGEAAFIPEFRGLGLRRRKGEIFYKGKNGEYAAAKFFGISESDADRLFLPSSYPPDKRGPLDVVRHIEELITRP